MGQSIVTYTHDIFPRLLLYFKYIIYIFPNDERTTTTTTTKINDYDEIEMKKNITSKIINMIGGLMPHTLVCVSISICMKLRARKEENLILFYSSTIVIKR